MGVSLWRRRDAVTIYGIKNCDTMRKARAWLDGHGVAYAFHDYKAQGIERARLEAWARDVGWETLLNRPHDLPQAAGQGQGRAQREEGARVDAGAAFDDEAAGPRYRRQASGGIHAGDVREGPRLASSTR